MCGGNLFIVRFEVELSSCFIERSYLRGGDNDLRFVEDKNCT